jgi:hypothetical protein
MILYDEVGMIFGRRYRTMAKTELQQTKKIEMKTKEQEPPLKGTLASVFLLGFFIIFSWVSVYLLYLHRL